MRKMLLVVLILGLVGGGIAIQRYLSAEGAARELRSRAKSFSSLLLAAENEGTVSSYQVVKIVQDLAAGVDGVTIPEGQIEVRAIPIEVGEGRTSCQPPPYPPELKQLNTLDQGNVRNLALRCVRGIHLIGFRARGRGPSGDPLQVESWGYVKSYGG